MNLYWLYAKNPHVDRFLRKIPGIHAIKNTDRVTDEDIVIRYGEKVAPDRGFWVINRKQALLTLHDRSSYLAYLHMAGVKTPSTTRKKPIIWQRQYRVALFNAQVIGCFRTEQRIAWFTKRIHQVTDVFEEIEPFGDEQGKRVCHYAMRALHALNLEMGLVSLGVTHHGKIGVIDVSATPYFVGRLATLYQQALTDFFLNLQELYLRNREKKILIGSDLEFMLKGKNKQMVLASRYFLPNGEIGCDARSLAGDKNKRPLAELRPKACDTPEELCNAIEELIRQVARKINRPYPLLLAGSAPFERFGIGGHIHFSGIPFSGRFVHLLDLYLGLPLMLIEDPRTARRRRPKYGYLGDIRFKEYGGFEYRTPASFLVDPSIALGTYALALTLANHFDQMPYYDLHERRLLAAFYNNDRETLLDIAMAVYASLKETSTYRQYQDAIDPIFWMIEKDEVWDEEIDLREAWGIEVMVLPPKRKADKARR